MDVKTLLDTPPWDWPKDARRTVRRTLIDPRADPSDREVAADLAGNLILMNDDMADSLLTIVSNVSEPEALRAGAAISFGPVLEQAGTDEFDDPDDVPITERMYHNIQDSLQKLYNDSRTPKEVRRRVLEASVRDPQDWHQDAIRTAYASGDRDWLLTAVFAMCWVRGFDDEILAQLNNKDPEIHCEAVEAAGNWELAPAWPHVVELVRDPYTPKPLLLAAIAAVATIRPTEAGVILLDLADSEDEDISEAVTDVMSMADVTSDEEDEDEEEEDEEDEWIN